MKCCRLMFSMWLAAGPSLLPKNLFVGLTLNVGPSYIQDAGGSAASCSAYKCTHMLGMAGSPACLPCTCTCCTSIRHVVGTCTWSAKMAEMVLPLCSRLARGRHMRAVKTIALLCFCHLPGRPCVEGQAQQTKVALERGDPTAQDCTASSHRACRRGSRQRAKRSCSQAVTSLRVWR